MYHVVISETDFSKTSGCRIPQENNKLLIINVLIPVFMAMKVVFYFLVMQHAGDS